MKSYLGEIEKTYNSEQGISNDFRNAAAKKAEYVLLADHVIKDNIGYELMLDIAAKYKRRDDSDWNLSGEQRATKHAIKDMIRRQGDEAVEMAFHAHREKMKNFRFQFG